LIDSGALDFFISKKTPEKHGGFMKKNHKAKREKTMPFEILFGLLAAVGSYLAFSLIFAVLLLLVNEPTKWASVFFVTAFLLSAATLGIILSRRAAGFGIYPCLISSVIFILILLSLSLIFNGFALPLLLSYALYVIISTLLCKFGGRKQKRRRRRA
jgi:hypothetical protein